MDEGLHLIILVNLANDIISIESEAKGLNTYILHDTNQISPNKERKSTTKVLCTWILKKIVDYIMLSQQDILPRLMNIILALL